MAVATTTRAGASRARSAARPRQSAASRTRTARKARISTNRLTRTLACAALLAGLFGYAGMHAHLMRTGLDRSETASLCRLERIRNERLKVEIERSTSPQAVMAAAEAIGMVYATEYDYIRPSAVARSAGGESRR